MLSCFIVSSSVQDGIYELGKAHMHSTPYFRSFPYIAFEMVPVFIWLMMALSRPFKEDHLALPLSTPLLPRDQWCDVLGFSSGLLKSKPLVRVSLPTSLFLQSFPFTPACPGQYTHRSFRRWMSTINTFHCGLPIPLFTFCSKLV